VGVGRGVGEGVGMGMGMDSGRSSGPCFDGIISIVIIVIVVILLVIITEDFISLTIRFGFHSAGDSDYAQPGKNSSPACCYKLYLLNDRD